MTEYTVRPKSAIAFSGRDHSRACLGISLGNSNERGDKLRAIVGWFNKTFSEVTIDLSDTLYRWNERDADGAVLSDAHDRAAARGDQWLAENADILSEFTIPVELIRWDYWLSRPDFAVERLRFDELYRTNEQFQYAVDLDVTMFIERQRKAGLAISPHAANNSRDFVLEELAAQSILFRERPGMIKAYPGGSLEAAAIIRRGDIHGAPRGLQGVPFVSLRIERATSALPDSLRPSQEWDIKPAA